MVSLFVFREDFIFPTIQMEAVDKVSSEVDKVITKFSAISEHANTLLSAEQASLEMLKATLLERNSR